MKAYPQCYSLLPHPDHPPRAVQAISVELGPAENYLLMVWNVTGYECVAVPPSQEPDRVDGLWQTTCFELFVKAGDTNYVEFNFSPSTQWAAYAFDDYRSGMKPFDCAIPAGVYPLADGIAADCEFAALPAGELRIGLSAVIEEKDGTKSFWALTHPPGPPDFHHPACFAATLPPPARP